MYRRGLLALGAFVVVSTALLLTACDGDDAGSLGSPVAPNGTPQASATLAIDETLPPVVAAREALAALSGRTPEEVEVVSVRPKQWPDACLGIQHSGDVCAQVITPGYEVVLRLDDNVAIYRTDEGTNVRLASGTVVVP